MKYIDAEKLIAEIERLKDKYPSWQLKLAMDDLCNFITSLQQEQPEVDLENIIRVEFGTRAKVEYGRRCVKLHWDEFSILVGRFYELGLNARKEK